MLAKNDNIVIGHGTNESFPHTVSSYVLKQAESGSKSLSCAVATPTRLATPCLPPKRPHHSA